MQKLKREQMDTTGFPVVTTPTMQNSWVSYDGGTDYGIAGYYKDAAGVVHLRGLIKSGTMGAAAFTLPAGFRPQYRCIFMGLSANNNTICRVDVFQNGQVAPQGGSGSNVWVSLEGMSFMAGA